MNLNTKTDRNCSLPCLGLLALALLFSACTSQNLEPVDPAELAPDWRTYYNQEVGVELRYPYTLSLEVDSGAADGQLVVELQWLGRQTPVFKLVTRDAGIGTPPADTGQGGGTVDGLPAVWSEIEGVDGEKEQRVSVFNRGREYIFTGAGSSFDKVLETVVFLDERPPVQPDVR